MKVPTIWIRKQASACSVARYCGYGFAHLITLRHVVRAQVIVAISRHGRAREADAESMLRFTEQRALPSEGCVQLTASAAIGERQNDQLKKEQHNALKSTRTDEKRKEGDQRNATRAEKFNTSPWKLPSVRRLQHDQLYPKRRIGTHCLAESYRPPSVHHARRTMSVVLTSANGRRVV